MPTISMFRGIKVCIYLRDHMPPLFHAFYGGSEIFVSSEELVSSCVVYARKAPVYTGAFFDRRSGTEGRSSKIRYRQKRYAV